MSNRIVSGLIYALFFFFGIKSESSLFLIVILAFFLIVSYWEFYNMVKSSKNILEVGDFILLMFFFPIIYLLCPIISIYLIKYEFGSNFLLFLVFIVWINDTSAFIIGKSIGKIKLSNISPDKTIEGVISSLCVCVLASFFLINFLKLETSINPFLLGAFISISSNFGDLLESFIKRKFKKKDSGKIMIGHGGILDRIDSLLVASPLFYIMLKIALN